MTTAEYGSPAPVARITTDFGYGLPGSGMRMRAYHDGKTSILGASKIVFQWKMEFAIDRLRKPVINSRGTIGKRPKETKMVYFLGQVVSANIAASGNGGDVALSECAC